MAWSLCACNAQEPAATNAPAAANAVASQPGAAAVNATASTLDDKAVYAAYTAEFGACMGAGEAKEGVDAAMQDCLDAELARQDARLNGAYKRVMRAADTTAQTQIRDQEKAWIKHKETTCNAPLSESFGGTGGALDRLSCLINETIRQTVVLEAGAPPAR